MTPVYGGVSNDELDSLIWHALRDRDGHPTRVTELIKLTGSGTRVDRRMQAMRKTGRIRLHRGPRATYPSHVRAHGWEVLGCPGAGIQEDGQFDWAYGCADCLRRVRPDPADGVIEPPGVVFEECELRIEPC